MEPARASIIFGIEPLGRAVTSQPKPKHFPVRWIRLTWRKCDHSGTRADSASAETALIFARAGVRHSRTGSRLPSLTEKTVRQPM